MYMANIQISVFIPEEWVASADGVAEAEDRSRNQIMSRWLEKGMAREGFDALGNKAQEKKSGSGSTGGFGDRKIPLGDAAEIERAVLEYGGGSSPAPDPVFGGNVILAPSTLDFPVAGFTAEGEQVPTDFVTAGGTVHMDASPVPDMGIDDLPVAGFNSLANGAGSNAIVANPDFVDFDITPPSGREVVKGGIPVEQIYQQVADSLPKVPEKAFEFVEYLNYRMEKELSVDPGIVSQAEKIHARTVQGVEKALDMQKAKRRKKIAGVVASAPGAGSTPKIGEKCLHGWANWLLCDICNLKAEDQ